MTHVSDPLFNINAPGLTGHIINSLSEAVVIVDQKGIICFVNNASSTLFGYTSEEIIGESISKLIPHKKRSNHTAFCSDHIKNPQTRRMGIGLDIEAVGKNGSLIPVEIGLSSFAHENETYIIAIITDISIRKNIQNDLNTNRSLYQAVFNKANDYIVLLDTAGTVLAINEKIEQGIGYKKADVVGKQLRELPFLPKSEIRKALRYYKKRFDGEAIDRYELRFLTRDGESIIGEINASLVDLGNGETADMVIIRDVTEQKNMLEEIQQSRDYFSNLVNNTLDMIIAVDNERNILLFNAAAETTFGYSRDEMVGKNISVLYSSPDIMSEVQEEMQKTGGYRGEILNKRKNGEIFSAYLSANTLFDKQGNIDGYLGVSRDITHQKMAEQIKEKLLHDLDNRIREINCLYTISKIADKHELSLQDVLKEIVMILPDAWQYPEDTCAEIRHDNLVLRSDKFTTTEWVQSAAIHVDGENVGSVSVYYLSKKTSQHEGPFIKEERDLLNTVADQIGKIIDHRYHERERIELINMLSEQKTELNTILESVGDAIMTTDRTYSIATANKALCEMIGLPYDRIIGHRCEEIFRCMNVPGSNACMKKCGLHETLEQMTPNVSRSKVMTFENKEIVIDSINTPLINTKGEVIGAVKSMRDVSKEVEIERMKNEFVSTVSHELRTPLTSIRGYVDLILDGDTGEINEMQAEFLDIIAQNTSRLTLLINDLLDIERIESGRITIKKQIVDLALLAEHTFKTMEPDALRKGLSYQKHLDNAAIVNVDPDRITQVLINLLSNAIKFTREGSVTMTLKKHAKSAILSVEDTGIGITKKDRDKLFSRFFRSDEVIRENIGGTGLGLSIVKSIIELHDGSITVDSNPGKGSVFTMTLPVHEE